MTSHHLPWGHGGKAGLVGLGLLALSIPAFTGLAGSAKAETTEQQTVPRDAATSIEAELDMDFGILKIDPAAAGSADLFVGDFTFDDDEWRPEVSYRLEGQTGVLDVQQPGDFGNLDFNDLDDIGQNDGNRWDVQLSRDVPLDLEVDLDTGSSELNLGGLDVRTLDVETNAGEITIDLSGGDWEQNLEAAIDSEAGSITLIVPAEASVRIDADTTVGDVDADGFERDGDAYVTAAYDANAPTLRFDVSTTVGEINLEVAS
jgi:hypothetical protein